MQLEHYLRVRRLSTVFFPTTEVLALNVCEKLGTNGTKLGTKWTVWLHLLFSSHFLLSVVRLSDF